MTSRSFRGGLSRTILLSCLLLAAPIAAPTAAWADRAEPAPETAAPDDLASQFLEALQPVGAGPGDLPATQWDERPEAEAWTLAAMEALVTHGEEIVATVPRDIGHWCPAYASNPPEERRAFWVGLMSAIAHYESRHLPHVVGAGRYYGLMQIYPPTARAVGCEADTGEELRSGTANLSCAVRILAVVVPDHEAIAIREGGWRGVANQWGPMTRATAREAMADWTREQDYCRMDGAVAASAVTEPAADLIAFADILPPELEAQ